MNLGCSLVGEQGLDEEEHLGLLDQVVAIFIHGQESVFKLGIVKVVGWWTVGKHGLEESLGFVAIKRSAVVDVELRPDLFDSLLVKFVFGNIGGQLPREGFVLLEYVIVDENLYVAGEALP